MINETNKAAGQKCAVSGPLVGSALSPHRVARTLEQCRVYPAGVALRAVLRIRLSRPAPRCSAQAPPGAVATATGALPARAPPPAERLRAPRQVRAGRCGAAGHCGRCAEGAGARGRARGRAETHGDAHSCPRGRVESWQSWRRAKQGAGRSRVRGPAADLGDPVASAAGECRWRTPRAGPAPPTRVRGSRVPRDRAVQARADLSLAGKPWPFAFGGTAPVAESCPWRACGWRWSLRPVPGSRPPRWRAHCPVRGDKDV